MEVKQFVNSLYNSNTFLISENKHEWVWLVDAGNIEDVLKSLSGNQFVKGVFLTHSHYDHICGINKLVEVFPDCIAFTSEHGKRGLFTDKLNLSFYHEDPIIFQGSNIEVLHENDKIELFEHCFLEVIETPGHNPGCLTYKAGEHLFTGDSYIPNIKIVTKLKGGDKEASKRSLTKIKSNISEDTIICPGHGEMARTLK